MRIFQLRSVEEFAQDGMAGYKPRASQTYFTSQFHGNKHLNRGYLTDDKVLYSWYLHDKTDHISKMLPRN